MSEKFLKKVKKFKNPTKRRVMAQVYNNLQERKYEEELKKYIHEEARKIPTRTNTMKINIMSIIIALIVAMLWIFGKMPLPNFNPLLTNTINQTSSQNFTGNLHTGTNQPHKSEVGSALQDAGLAALANRNNRVKTVKPGNLRNNAVISTTFKGTTLKSASAQSLAIPVKYILEDLVGDDKLSEARVFPHLPDGRQVTDAIIASGEFNNVPLVDENGRDLTFYGMQVTLDTNIVLRKGGPISDIPIRDEDETLTVLVEEVEEISESLLGKSVPITGFNTAMFLNSQLNGFNSKSLNSKQGYSPYDGQYNKSQVNTTRSQFKQEEPLNEEFYFDGEETMKSIGLDESEDLALRTNFETGTTDYMQCPGGSINDRCYITETGVKKWSDIGNLMYQLKNYVGLEVEVSKEELIRNLNHLMLMQKYYYSAEVIVNKVFEIVSSGFKYTKENKLDGSDPAFAFNGGGTFSKSFMPSLLRKPFTLNASMRNSSRRSTRRNRKRSIASNSYDLVEENVHKLDSIYKRIFLLLKKLLQMNRNSPTVQERIGVLEERIPNIKNLLF